MMLVSYWFGQKHFPVPYATKKLVAYIIIAVVFFLVFELALRNGLSDALWQTAVGAILFLVYLLFILKVEKKEFATLPLMGRFIAKL
jgi:ABC-type uncharacterized transport system permease subunit